MLHNTKNFSHLEFPRTGVVEIRIEHLFLSDVLLPHLRLFVIGIKAVFLSVLGIRVFHIKYI